jgi:hypothetical protein
MYSLKNIAKVLLLSTSLAVGASAQAPSSATEQKNMQAFLDALRKDLRTEKQAIIDQAMGLDAAGKAKFWGIYEGYQKELNVIWDARLANVKTYAETYQSMTDEVANQLALSGLKNEEQGTALRRKYYGIFKAAMGAKVAARWLQAETALNALATVQLLSQVPLLQ